MPTVQGDSREEKTPRVANAILAALTETQRRKLMPRLKEVVLRQGTVLHEEGEIPNNAYFLTEGVAALTISTDDGRSLALSMVGREGIVGERAIFEGGLPLMRCAMLTDGHAFKMSPTDLSEEFHEGGKLHDLIMRSLEARLAETSQTALCNQMHHIQQRACRWLLSCADRACSSQLPITQEVIAELLGARRPGVSVALGELRDAGFIQYSRGHIAITNRKGLEQCSCECYLASRNAVRAAYKSGA